MQLLPVHATPAPRTTFGALRAGGPASPPATGVVAQAHVAFTRNFGATGLLDVMAGARLSQHYTLEDALEEARLQAAARSGAVGVLAASRPGSFFELRALEVFDVDGVAGGASPPWSGIDWSSARRVPLRLGATTGGHGSLGRQVLGVVGVDQPGAMRLVHVVAPD